MLAGQRAACPFSPKGFIASERTLTRGQAGTLDKLASAPNAYKVTQRRSVHKSGHSVLEASLEECFIFCGILVAREDRGHTPHPANQAASPFQPDYILYHLRVAALQKREYTPGPCHALAVQGHGRN